ncbi:MAG: alkyl hydroperoxide reductase/Thiol specific antioxidant/Mal allergen [Bacteroidetes bacterium]|nr:MAG: alkyl hydroperoxide reductase/Thiol specific antioxidant/Mal allergen [Bacteroidota bacterium]
MKKTLSILAGAALLSTGAFAQLANGSIAPDWTFTDINGNSHHLYDYLDQGKVVIIDVSATWCGPCWNYHNSGNLENFYNQYGPPGTNQAMVFYIEGDGATTLADVQGTGTNTQGDWTAGTPYPIINPSSSATTTFDNDYNIGYFPTIYKVCPNRIIEEVGQITTAQLATEMGQCPAPASQPIDAAILQYTGATATCGTTAFSVVIQNNGLTPLTSATVTATSGVNTLGTGTYTGSLATYGIATVSFSGNITSTQNVTFTVTTSGDASASNDVISQNIIYSTLAATSNNLTINITTDRYGAETTWKLFNSAGTVVSQGGPYTNMSSAGAYPQTPVNVNAPNDCYRFEIYDSYGDGMCCAYGNGFYSITTGTTTVTNNTNFTGTQDTKAFSVTATGLNEYSAVGSMNLYPNPFSGIANLSYTLNEGADVKMIVTNMLGEVVSSIDYGSRAAGEYTATFDGSSLPAGMYFFHLQAGDHSVMKKATITK